MHSSKKPITQSDTPAMGQAICINYMKQVILIYFQENLGFVHCKLGDKISVNIITRLKILHCKICFMNES